MRVSVLAVQKAWFRTLVLNESFISCDVVSQSVGTRFAYLAKVNVSNVRLVDDYVGSAHDGTVVEKPAPLFRVILFPADP